MKLRITRVAPLSIFVALGFAVSPAWARVRLAGVFADHMVLQQDLPVPVWGTADAGQTIKVTILGQTKTATAGPDGKWLVKLDPLKSDEPTTLTVEGESTVTVRDVLVGEVWLCSGQSNMALPVSKAQDFEREAAAAKWPKIREFGTKWVTCSPETVGNFSATAYFFGREIHQKLNRPVGLLHRSAGGTPIEYWTSLKAQKEAPELRPIFETPATAQAESPEAAAQAASDRAQAVEVEGKKAVTSAKQARGSLYESRIVPLVPYAIRGVVWYQGEANSYTTHANLYGKQLETMINDWRRQWGSELPFVTVQLPDFGKAQTEPVELQSGRARVREGMLDTLRLPHTGMAVTLGTGEVASNHPRNKQEAGRRLALWALANVYQVPGVVGSGPLPQRCQITGGRVTITFSHTEGGLVARGDKLQGFAIAGADQKWVWANATIQGDTVIVSHPEVKEPVAVRYAWATNPESSNLCNGAGLPATPFRTDGPPLSHSNQR